MARRKKNRNTRNKEVPPSTAGSSPKTSWRRWSLLAYLAITVVALVAWRMRPAERIPVVAAKAALSSLEQLVAMAPQELENMDIALMNLRCAEGLPGSEGLDLAAALKTLDQFAKHVDKETTRHFYRFSKSPEQFQNSEAYFRLMMMAVILQEDMGVHYSPKRIEPLDDFQPDEAFCADSRDVFLHGLTGPPMMGTCASLPVLYVAVGRRLGYPLFLSTTKNHLFLRWEDGRARLNMECTSDGFSSYEDDYYKTWPFKVTDEEIKAEGYLKTMTPTEELACFLMMRGPCLMVAKHHQEALAIYRGACRLAPNIRTNQLTLAANEHEVKRRMIHEMNLRMDGVDYFWDREETRRAAERAQRKKAQQNE